jgi:hypothetical protein
MLDRRKSAISTSLSAPYGSMTSYRIVLRIYDSIESWIDRRAVAQNPSSIALPPKSNYINSGFNQNFEGISSDTSVIEDEIDQMVYQLYGLAEEEIRIVEAETN